VARKKEGDTAPPEAVTLYRLLSEAAGEGATSSSCEALVRAAPARDRALFMKRGKVSKPLVEHAWQYLASNGHAAGRRFKRPLTPPAGSGLSAPASAGSKGPRKAGRPALAQRGRPARGAASRARVNGDPWHAAQNYLASLDTQIGELEAQLDSLRTRREQGEATIAQLTEMLASLN
jgi:hypothetical protein